MNDFVFEKGIINDDRWPGGGHHVHLSGTDRKRNSVVIDDFVRLERIIGVSRWASGGHDVHRAESAVWMTDDTSVLYFINKVIGVVIDEIHAIAAGLKTTLEYVCQTQIVRV